MKQNDLAPSSIIRLSKMNESSAFNMFAWQRTMGEQAYSLAGSYERALAEAGNYSRGLTKVNRFLSGSK